MASYAGPAPWYQGVSETYKNGRRKPRLVSGDQEWDMHGWHAKRKAGWYNQPSRKIREGGHLKKVTVKKRKVTAPDGTQVEMYKTEGYDDYIGFHNNGTDEKALDYALAAFNKKTQQGPIFEESTDEGHIKKVEYAEAQKVMRVTFWNNAIVFYFRVPTQLAGMLLSTARTNRVSYTDKRGIGRHALGRLFWELVRIKGQVRGSRYPFQYLKRGNYSFTGSNKQYRIKLTPDNYEMVNGFKFENRPGQPKPGETILSPIPLEEFERNARLEKAIIDKKELERRFNEDLLDDNIKHAKDYDDKDNKVDWATDVGARDEIAAKENEIARENFIDSKPYKDAQKHIMENSALSPEERARYDEYESELKLRKEQKYSEDKAKKLGMLNEFYTNETSLEDAAHIAGLHGETTAKLRYLGSIHENGKTNYNPVRVRKDAGSPNRLFNKDDGYTVEEYNALKRKANRTNLARNMFQRVWTKNELRNMDMRLQTAAERRAYNAFISAEDWTGALEYLKGKSGVINIKNADGSVTRQAGKLAGASDVVE